MGEIVLTRIDDRLIHGQVMTAWVKEKRADEIIIVDNGVSKDSFLSEVMKMSAPSGVNIKVESIETGAEELMKISDGESRVIVLVKSPATILELIEKGVDFKKVIVGGMGLNPQRKTLYKNIATSEEEKEQLTELIERGTETTIHIIPSEKEIKLDKYL